MWLYGSGFPKSLNIGLAIDKKNGIDNRTGNIKNDGKATNSGSGCYNCNNGKDNSMKREYEERIAQNKWQGWGTCLKPAFEPIIVARKPFKGSLVDNVIKWGVGGLNIDECRVGNEEGQNPQAGFIRRGRTDEEVFLGTDKNRPKGNLTVNGRFPANLILTYNQLTFDDVCGGFPYTKGNGNIRKNKTFTGGIARVEDKYIQEQDYNTNGYEDSGSASRYFYCAKASKKDRDEGLDEFEEVKCSMMASNHNIDKDGNFTGMLAGRQTLKKNIHPTVKPTELMQYLIRLVTPNGGVILDPFMGSGSTGKAVVYENRERNKNYDFIGIEKEEEYYNIAKARIENI